MVKYLLALGLYLLDTEVKENTGGPFTANHVGTAALGCPVERSSTLLPGWNLRSLAPPDGRGQLSHVICGGYRSLGCLGDHQHFVHLNLDFSAKLRVRLIRIGC